MKSGRSKRRQRTKGEAFVSEPAVVPTRPVVFEELKRRGWVRVMGQSASPDRAKRRS